MHHTVNHNEGTHLVIYSCHACHVTISTVFFALKSSLGFDSSRDTDFNALTDGDWPLFDRVYIVSD